MDLVVLKGETLLGTMFKQISWSNRWFSLLKCELFILGHYCNGILRTKGCRSGFLCAQPAPGCPRLCQTCCSSEHLSSTAWFQDWLLSSFPSQMDVVRETEKLEEFPIIKPHIYWQFPCQKLVFWGAAQLFAASASPAHLQPFSRWVDITVVYHLPFYLILFYHQSFPTIFWPSHLLPSCSFFLSPSQGSALCPAAHLSASAPSHWQQCAPWPCSVLPPHPSPLPSGISPCHPSGECFTQVSSISSSFKFLTGNSLRLFIEDILEPEI